MTESPTATATSTGRRGRQRAGPSRVLHATSTGFDRAYKGSKES